MERKSGKRVRIFTVQEELPFAGHPTLGTAFFLRGTTGVAEVTLDLNVGAVPVRFEATSGQPVFGEMTQVEPKFGPAHDRETVVRATSLRDGDIDPSLPIQSISTGMTFTVVPLRGLEAIRRAASRPQERRRISGAIWRREIFLFCNPGNSRPRGAAPRSHAVLQRRRSCHRLGGRLHRGVDGRKPRGQAR